MVTAESDQQNAVTAAAPETSISLLGLTPRAVAAIDRLGATTVKDFLAVPLRRAYRLPGSKIRREVVEAFNALRARFPDLVPKRIAAKEADTTTDPGEGAATSIDVLVPEALNLIQKRPGSEKQVFQCLLGLNDSGFDSPYEWPAAAQVASRLTLSRGFVDQCLDSARQRWSITPEITALGETIAGSLQSHCGVMTAADLSLAVLTARGSTEEEPVRSAMSSAVTRAALETEVSQAQPRFLIHRRGTIVLVAQSAELADYAAELGKKADELAGLDPLPNPIRVVESLRAIEAPSGTPMLPESVLVASAAHASTHAAVSSKFELYARGMPAKRALMLAQNALTGVCELTVRQVHQRVLSRYPEAEPFPDRPELDPLLSDSGLDLVWHPELAQGTGAYRFRAYEEASTLSTGTILPERKPTAAPVSAPVGETSAEIVEARVIESKLRRAAAEGAFLVLAVPPCRMLRAEHELLRFDLERRNVDELVIRTLRAEAQAVRIPDWNVVLRADGAPRQSDDWKRLLLLVNRAMPKVEQELSTSPKTLLLVNPGLLARYQQLELLVRLRDRIGLTGSPLHGLWVLVPTSSQAVLPTLDGLPVPVLSAAQWTQLTPAWIDYALHSAAELVGNRHSLTARQRIAVSRCACTDEARQRRSQREIIPTQLRDHELWIDGFNVLTGIEAALAGGVILLGCDGCLRDLANSYARHHEVQETLPALRLLGAATAAWGVRRCQWWLDRPVSNSGRLKRRILDLAAANGWDWQVELVFNPDKLLAESSEVIATADSAILDRCQRWVNLARLVITQNAANARIIDLRVEPPG